MSLKSLFSPSQMVSVLGGELFHFASRIEAQAHAAGRLIFQLAFFSSSAAIFVLMAAFNLLRAEQKNPLLRHWLHFNSLAIFSPRTC